MAHKVKVVFTGASGFIGRHILPVLLAAGFEVHALCRRRCIEKDMQMEGVYWHFVDLMDCAAAESLLATIKATHMLHLAWYTKHDDFWSASENLDWVDISLNLLKCFVRQGGKRVVVAGSCAEYEWGVGVCRESETAYKPATLYGISKHKLHEHAKEYCSRNSLSFAWGHVFFLFGPHEAEKRFVPLLVRGLLSGNEVPCSSGSQVRDFMHVSDVADAFVRLLSSDFQGAVNIASGNAYALHEIGGRLMRLIQGKGRINFGALPNRLGEPQTLIADTYILKRKLDWTPSYTLDKGLTDTVAWWKERNMKMNKVKYEDRN